LALYLDLLKDLGNLFSKDSILKPKDFSYKNKKAQCPECKGKGYVETSLDVVANALETCPTCNGQRYNQEILSIKFHEYNIAEVLSLSISNFRKWLEELGQLPKTWHMLDQLMQIGLGHLRMDQPVQSLSSGEKQRLQLLQWLQNNHKDQLYILDEPSTGLHYADIDLLLGMLKELSRENDVLVIDHNPYLLQSIEVGLEL